MSTQVQHASILSGRQVVFAATVALHAAAIAALMAWRIAEVMQRPLDPIQITDPIPNPDPPRPLPPDPVDRSLIQTIDVPRLPERIDLHTEEDPQKVVTARVTDDGVPPGGSGASKGVARLAPPADTPLRYRATRSPDDYYPAQAIRLEQEGVAIVQVCTDAGGALSAAPQVTKSSRSRLLDAAAVTWAREALQFTPATRAGAAVAACKEFRVNFTLH